MSMQISVKLNATANTITVDNVSPTDKVEDIKKKIFEKQGIPPDQQRLVFSGKLLQEGRQIQDYGIQNGIVLDCMLHLRGGF